MKVIVDECTSHGHFDHMQKFPSSVDLGVGRGIKDADMPGRPKREVPLREADFAGRSVREISSDESDLKIRDSRAVNFFGDGSFYLVDAPGVSLSPSMDRPCRHFPEARNRPYKCACPDNNLTRHIHVSGRRFFEPPVSAASNFNSLASAGTRSPGLQPKALSLTNIPESKA